jgi:hypothetical protein
MHDRPAVRQIADRLLSFLRFLFFFAETNLKCNRLVAQSLSFCYNFVM